MEYVERVGDRLRAYMALMEKPGGKKPFGRPGHRRDDNIKKDSAPWRK